MAVTDVKESIIRRFADIIEHTDDEAVLRMIKDLLCDITRTNLSEVSLFQYCEKLRNKYGSMLDSLANN